MKITKLTKPTKPTKHKKHMMIIILILVLVLLIPFLYWQNNSIVITHHDYINSEFPTQFDGFKVVQISDLHNKSFGKSQKYLIEKIEVERPDAIFVTGDLIDSRKTDVETAVQFIEKAVQIAPVYYVSGNHEQRVLSEYGALKAQMAALGVMMLENSSVVLEKGGERLTIIGVDDPKFQRNPYEIEGENLAIATYLESASSVEGFKILLSHRPELFPTYIKHHMNAVFSGHAHGGQIRLPLIGGIIAPNQGVFPELTSGKHEEGLTTLFISRGLGNSLFPQRIFNRPEIVVVTFSTQKEK